MNLLDSPENESEREPNFIVDVLRFPITKSGFPILTMGMILIIAASFGSIIPMLGFFCHLFVFAYLCGLYFALIDLSASGEDEIYCFPDLSDPIDDIAKPAAQVVLVVLLSFAPLIGVRIGIEESDPNFHLFLYLGLGWAAFYFPMAMLATVLFSSLYGLLPHIVFPAIFRSGPLYLIAFGLTLILAVVNALPQFISFPDNMTTLIVIQAVSAFVSMYVLMASARTLGLLYFRREDEIGWFA